MITINAVAISALSVELMKKAIAAYLKRISFIVWDHQDESSSGI